MRSKPSGEASIRKQRMNSCAQRHHLVALVALDPVVLPPEGDAVVIDREQRLFEMATRSV